MIKHLIFDFDGTISDSYPQFMKIFRKFSKEKSWELPYDDETLLHELLVSVKYVHKTLGWDQFMPYDEFWSEFSEMQAEMFKEFRPFPEAVELLRYATQKGIQCYIYTHSGKVVPERMLPNMGIDQYITYTIDKTMGFAEKPAPDALLHLIEKFSLDPSECMMIGDRPIDAKCGQNAGMKGCLWDLYGIFKDATPDIYVTHLEDVKKYL